MEKQEIFENRIDLSGLNNDAKKLREQLSRVIIGQEKMIEHILVAILANGHILIEGVPGIAKTLTAKLMARSVSSKFSRIQFTPDLMPSDVVGTSIFNTGNSTFEFNPGPVFANLILIDEINRAPAKTQSALFEVMEERQVTVDGSTYQMQKPFIVFATQNPIEQEGTYRLPEAQIDRFLFKINISYPSIEEEVQILSNDHSRKGKDKIQEIESVFNGEQIVKYQELIHHVHIDENLRIYIAQIINKTRNHQAVYLGASPRASLAIQITAKAFAAIQGRDFVTPEDVQEMVFPVLRHRLILTPEKEMEGAQPDEVIKQIVNTIKIPR